MSKADGIIQKGKPMKPLILLLFFTFTAGAQEPWKYHGQPTRFKIDTLISRTQTFITLEDLEGYLAECEEEDAYALRSRLRVLIMKHLKTGAVPTVDLVALTTPPKTEPTLQGFMEYLKRRRRAGM